MRFSQGWLGLQCLQLSPNTERWQLHGLKRCLQVCLWCIWSSSDADYVYVINL